MTEALAELLGLSQAALFVGFVTFLRVGSAMALIPAFGEQVVPARVRLVLALAFTAIVAPAIGSGLAPLAERAGGLPIWFLSEIGIGLLLGMLLRMFVIALQIAGTIAAQASSLSQLFGGTSGEPQPAVGNLLVAAGLAVAAHLGLHVKLAELLIGSYTALPPGQFPDGALVRSWGLSGVGHAFTLGFSIAAPFLIAGLIYNVALGAINRAMPQLMVAFVGAPALTLGGLVLFALALPGGLALWLGAFDQFLANPFTVAP